MIKLLRYISSFTLFFLIATTTLHTAELDLAKLLEYKNSQEVDYETAENIPYKPSADKDSISSGSLPDAWQNKSTGVNPQQITDDLETMAERDKTDVIALCLKFLLHNEHITAKQRTRIETALKLKISSYLYHNEPPLTKFVHGVEKAQLSDKLFTKSLLPITICNKELEKNEPRPDILKLFAPKLSKQQQGDLLISLTKAGHHQALTSVLDVNQNKHINIQTLDGKTLLIFAVANQHKECVKTLLDRGINPLLGKTEAEAGKPRTPLGYARYVTHCQNQDTAYPIRAMVRKAVQQKAYSGSSNEANTKNKPRLIGTATTIEDVKTMPQKISTYDPNTDLFIFHEDTPQYDAISMLHLINRKRLQQAETLKEHFKEFWHEKNCPQKINDAVYCRPNWPTWEKIQQEAKQREAEKRKESRTKFKRLKAALGQNPMLED